MSSEPTPPTQSGDLSLPASALANSMADVNEKPTANSIDPAPSPLEMFDVRDCPAGINIRAHRITSDGGVLFGLVHNESRQCLDAIEVLVTTAKWQHRFVWGFLDGLRDGHTGMIGIETWEALLPVSDVRVLRATFFVD